MSRSSPRVYLVVDPAQDYEESLRILGVHGSLEAAMFAVRGYRRRRVQLTGVGGRWWPLIDSWRDVEVQLWQGDQQLDTWTQDGRSGRWTHAAVERGD